ncbi:hypothetical protein YC2023_040539 [Brassica napus]
MTSVWPPAPGPVTRVWPPAPRAVTSGWPPAPRAVSSTWPPALGAVACVWPPGVRGCVPRLLCSELQGLNLLILGLNSLLLLFMLESQCIPFSPSDAPAHHLPLEMK